MGDDLTAAEIDELFAVTQPIGDAIHALVEARLAADSDADAAALLGRVVQAVTGATDGRGTGR